MSQYQWDLLEKSKQDIIDGKLLLEIWGFEILEGINDTLTEEEMKEVFRCFPGYSNVFYEIAGETLEQIVEDVVKEREKATA